MNNKYGLDANYMRKRMERMVRDLDQYTPDEAFNELSRMALVAADQARLKVKITVKQVAQRQGRTE